MRSIAPMKIAKIGYIVMASIIAAMGLSLILFPEISLKLIGILFGVTISVFGFVKLVGYFSKDLYCLAFENDLASGILMIVLGTVLWLRPEHIMNFFCTVLGILILSDGLLKLQIAIESRSFGLTKWWLIMISAILAIMLGIALLFRPDESMRAMTVLFGVSLMVEGILNISTVLTAVKIIRNQRI